MPALSVTPHKEDLCFPGRGIMRQLCIYCWHQQRCQLFRMPVDAVVNTVRVLTLWLHSCQLFNLDMTSCKIQILSQRALEFFGTCYHHEVEQVDRGMDLNSLSGRGWQHCGVCFLREDHRRRDFLLPSLKGAMPISLSEQRNYTSYSILEEMWSCDYLKTTFYHTKHRSTHRDIYRGN